VLYYKIEPKKGTKMAFPPLKSNKQPVSPPQVTGERGPISTGKGGIKASLKIKNASIVNAPGVEKNVNLF